MSNTMTIITFERPVPTPHNGVWGLLALAIAKPAKWSKQPAVTLSANATINRKLLGV